MKKMKSTMAKIGFSVVTIAALATGANATKMTAEINQAWYPKNQITNDAKIDLIAEDEFLKGYSVANIKSNYWTKGIGQILTNHEKYSNLAALDDNSLVTELDVFDIYGGRYIITGEKYKDSKDGGIYKKARVVYAYKSNMIQIDYLVNDKKQFSSVKITDLELNDSYSKINVKSLIAAMQVIDITKPQSGGGVKRFIEITQGKDKQFNETLASVLKANVK